MAGQTPSDLPAVTTVPCPPQSDRFLDSEKTGVALLFSGVFLGLIGVGFTILGWQHYNANTNFEWPQLLGPILISVGGSFMLTSICRFGLIHCWLCGHWDEDVVVMPAIEQTSITLPFTLNGISQSIMLHGTTAVVCIPPNFATQERNHAAELQPSGSVNTGLPPQYDAVCCAENIASREEEGGGGTEKDNIRSRSQKTETQEDEGGCGGESSSTCPRPPAYEDIYPSFNKRNGL